MEYLLNAKQMKMTDKYSIQNIGIPSVVLMERAALAVTERIIELSGKKRELNSKLQFDTYGKNVKAKVVCVCGTGNNGADGLAVARQLHLKGFKVDVLCIGNEKKATEEYILQKNILENIGLCIRNNVQFGEYDYIVDAIFGIGLTREVQGDYADIIRQINVATGNQAAESIGKITVTDRSAQAKPMVIAVDIASGINSTDGRVMGCAVKADETVTFGFKKIGMVLYPGRSYSGKIMVADIGFVPFEETAEFGKVAYTYSIEDLAKVPLRKADVNKGSSGKVLIIAGSESMGGAACLSAQAAYRSGCGLVRVFTHKDNRDILLNHVPEAIPVLYDESAQNEQLSKTLIASCEWADCVIIGPGLSMSETAKYIVKEVLRYFGENDEEIYKKTAKKTLIADADALNIISSNYELKELVKNVKSNIIITPHIGEMARMTGMSIADIKADLIQTATNTANELGVICVLKDAATIVTNGEAVYINSSGNAGMATAGSGDVLTGIIAGMVCAGFDNVIDAAAMAVNIHGLAGDICREEMGVYGMKAGDLTDAMTKLWKNV